MTHIRYILVTCLIATALFAAETSRCLTFSDDAYVHLDDDPLKFTTRFTIECWFNVHEFTDSAALIDFGTSEYESNPFIGYGIYTLDSNRIAIRLANTSRYFELVLDSIKSGIWQHLALTYDKFKNDENIVVFLNGNVLEKADCDVYLDYPNTGQPYGMYIGAYHDGSHVKAFNGELDDIRFWTVLRSNQEIRNNLDRTLDDEAAGLVGYYCFDQDAEPLLYDRSPSENHGTLVNIADSSWHLSYAHLAVEQPTDVSSDRVVLSWMSSHLFTSYLVDMSDNKDFTASVTGFPVDGITSNYYIVDDITPGTYYFRVKGHYDGEDPAREPWTDIQSVSTVSDAATPIELIDLSTCADASGIRVTWQTASQTENAFFQLERCDETSGWEVVYRTPGAGTTTETMSYSFFDDQVIKERSYFYRLKDISLSGASDVSKIVTARIPEESTGTAPHFELCAVYPNPFNPETKISFNLSEASDVTVYVCTLRGKKLDILCSERFNSGTHELIWRPDDLSSGIYLLAINSKNTFTTHKLLYLK